MAKESNEPSPTRLDSGWSDLQEGRWKEARARFEQAVGAEETPEGFEGLSWAAWWLDDAEAVFDARERAYRLYEEAGDVAGAARMATWLACDQLDFHGAFAVAGGWLGRAHRLLDPLEPGPEHGWLAFLEGYMAHAGDDTAKAAEFGRRSAELGRRFDVPDLEMLGLALEGATLVARAQVEEGMRCLDEATVTRSAGRGHGPDLGCVGLLLPGHGVHRGARLRAGVRVVRPDRRVRRALREPLHARLLPRRVRRGAPLAGPVEGGGSDA